MKYIEWLDTWLQLYVKPNCKLTTVQKYQQNIDKHIRTDLGEYSLEQLSAMVLQRFTVNLSCEKKLAPSTANGIIAILKKSLKIAHFVGIVDKVESDKIIRPRIIEKEACCLSKTEQRKLENYLLSSPPNNKYFGIFLCLYTGLRIGELIALEWKDFDFRKGILKITKTCSYGKNEQGVYARRVTSPKTSSSNRIIPLPKQILPTIKEYKSMATTNYVISSKGKPVSMRNYQRVFEKLLKKLKINHKNFHALRHTFATRALESGMDIKTLAEIMGHKNPSITLKRYAHSMFEHKIQMMNRLGRLFVYKNFSNIQPIEELNTEANRLTQTAT